MVVWLDRAVEHLVHDVAARATDLEVLGEYEPRTSTMQYA